MSATKVSIYAAMPTTVRGEGVHLSTDAKGTRITYAAGKAVIIRDLQNPSIAKEYNQHIANTTVAKFSPSGFYIASGDERGNVRVWDTVGDEQILKIESRAINGKVKDLAWDGESKRIIAVGDGREKFGHAFMADSGSSCGEIMGHNKVVNTVAISQGRPFRAVTGGDDNSLVFSHGVPFVYNKTIQDHTRYVQEVKFSNNGAMFASVGSDGKIFLYDAKTGDKIKELSTADQGHTGGIFALSWSADSSRILTSSADQTAKIWDVEKSSVVNTFELADPEISYFGQQVGNAWAGDHLLSLSLSGNLNYLDPSTSKTSRTVFGHQKGITALAVSDDRKTFFSGSYEGRVISWNAETGAAEPLTSATHSNQVMQMTSVGGNLYSAGMDDTIRVTNIGSEKASSASVVSTNAQPKSLSVSQDGTVVVATEKEIQVIQGGRKVDSLAVTYEASAVAINAQGTQVAVGAQDSKVYLLTLQGTKLTLAHTLANNKGAISSLAYSPDGTSVAAGDSAGKIYVFDTTSGAVTVQHWVFHTARVTTLEWSADGKYAVSGSLDTNIFVWEKARPMKKISIKNAHSGGVSGTSFVDATTIVSTGADANVKTWKLTHNP